jgi:hypothetical protein
MNLFKPLFPRPSQRPPTRNDELSRFLSPSEVIKRAPANVSPEPRQDPARDAAMNFVRQLKIYAR